MTTDIETILAAAQTLPPAEQLELLRRLAESLGGSDLPLESAAARIWASSSLDGLAAAQHIPRVANVQTLAMPDWPEEESADDVFAHVRTQRHVASKA